MTRSPVVEVVAAVVVAAAERKGDDDGLSRWRSGERVTKDLRSMLSGISGDSAILATVLAAAAAVVVVREDGEAWKSNLVSEVPKERGQTFPCLSRIY